MSTASTRRVRFESWGAWIRVSEPSALVAIDHEGLAALGIDTPKTQTGKSDPTAPLEVHLAVTARCAMGCTGCYMNATPDGAEPPFEELVTTLKRLGDSGVFTVAFGGGEPLTRPDLGELAEAARDAGLTPVLTTSGAGMTPEKARSLAAFAQVNVSYDGGGETYESIRGYRGAAMAERAIELLFASGVRVGVNVVLTRETFPHLTETLNRARALGVCEAQLLRYKPQGRAASLDYFARRLSRSQVLSFGRALRDLSEAFDGATSFPIRIDCALVPFLSSDDAIMGAPQLLARFGVLGCEAGRMLGAVTVSDKRAPCSFLTPESDASAQSERSEPWPTVGNVDVEPCASCSIATTCRGGCRVVSRFSSSGLQSESVSARGDEPDPECPRVIRHRTQSNANSSVLRRESAPS